MFPTGITSWRTLVCGGSPQAARTFRQAARPLWLIGNGPIRSEHRYSSQIWFLGFAMLRNARPPDCSLRQSGKLPRPYRTVTLSLQQPRSCDTFVVLPPGTADGAVVFGKNSDRPTREVQELLTVPAANHAPGSTLQCTYITIPQASSTQSVVLSKPSWMWGAEMGANAAGVVIGNEAVWTKEPDDGPPALLGMDLVRLGLERGSNAWAAVDVITQLLEQHGQGGPCEEGGSWSYHNSFLVADRKEAWVVETAGSWWAAERVAAGPRNISNCLSIRTCLDAASPGLQQHAQHQGWWDGKQPFDWAAAFSSGSVPPVGRKNPGREAAGCILLKRLIDQVAAAAGSSNGQDQRAGFSEQHMMQVLRDKGSGICMTGAGEDAGFRTNGAQVSVLLPDQEAIHWFTGTPDPSRSIFKPFRFSEGLELGPLVTGASEGPGAAVRNPPHALWKAWSAAARESLRRRSSSSLQGVVPPFGLGEKAELAQAWTELEQKCRHGRNAVLHGGSSSSGGSGSVGSFAALAEAEWKLCVQAVRSTEAAG